MRVTRSVHPLLLESGASERMMQNAPGTDSDRDAAPSRPEAAPSDRALRRALGGRSGNGVLWTVVLVAIAAGAWGLIDVHRASVALQRATAERLTASDAALSQARAVDADLANRLRTAQTSIASLETQVGAFQAQQASLDALYRDLAPSRDELALTEIEQILVLASQQLSLAGNVQAALTALQVADGKLAELDRPQFATLRQALAQDIDALKAVPYIDVTGIAIKLDQVIAAVDTLPLARDERVAPAPYPPRAAAEPAWRRLVSDLWAQVHDIVRIEVTSQPAAPLVTPSQAFFLRENLRLRLLSARIGLLSRNERSFRADLRDAIAWLNEYFDITSRPVQSALATLVQQAQVTMPHDMPTLVRSLDAARALEAAGERGDRRATDPSAAPAR
ncbi:MAG: uroporphyrinogen-III C-methyltransferase [Casimicrobiaceae bacterium]